jgi:hypothetical protein
MVSKSYKIIKEHISSFPDPITLKKGDKVFIGREYSENPDWPNWIECKTQNGKKGWVPNSTLSHWFFDQQHVFRVVSDRRIQ